MMMMIVETWRKRTAEEKFLFNPAFCSLLISSACYEYQVSSLKGMSYPLAFFILPLTLHKQSRLKLPKRSNALMALWIQENISARIALHENITPLIPYTKEAIFFASDHKLLKFSGNGVLEFTGNKKNINSASIKLEGEARECFLSSRMLGKWFSASGTDEVILSLWGVLP